AETEEQRVNMARGLMADTLLRLGMLGSGALLLVWFTVSAALRPLDRLRTAVEEREPDDLRSLPMVEAQFIADAAHELRTPLAALKARVELGLRDQEPAAWRSTLESAAMGTDKLTHLANQLLSLARIENGARAIAEGGAQLLDLSQLAREL
nr:hypothetical protein [Tanacetum cinerariifolium]